MAESVEAPDVRSLQTLTAASATWGGAVAFGLGALGSVALAIHNFITPTASFGNGVASGVFHILVALPLLVMAFLAVRLGFGLRRGTTGPEAVLLAAAWAILLAVIAVRTIWLSTMGSNAFNAQRTPAVLLLICAGTVLAAALVWRNPALRTVSGLAACCAGILFIVIGTLPSTVSGSLLVPAEWLAGSGVLLVAVGLLLRSWPTARAFGSFTNAIGVLLLGIAAVVTMTSTLQQNPFGGRFSTQAWLDLTFAFNGAQAIAFGIAGIAALLWVLLALVSNGPALASSARKAVAAPPARSCGKCGAGLPGAARFCNSCGAKAA
jgi:uncharacterized membrane protein